MHVNIFNESAIWHAHSRSLSQQIDHRWNMVIDCWQGDKLLVLTLEGSRDRVKFRRSFWQMVPSQQNVTWNLCSLTLRKRWTYIPLATIVLPDNPAPLYDQRLEYYVCNRMTQYANSHEDLYGLPVLSDVNKSRKNGQEAPSGWVSGQDRHCEIRLNCWKSAITSSI